MVLLRSKLIASDMRDDPAYGARRRALTAQPAQIDPAMSVRESLAAIAQACGATTEMCDDLTDIDYGAWQFKTYDQAKRDDPALFAAWFATPHLVRFPDGETLQELAARAANVMRLMLARHIEQTVVLVGHDSVNRTLLLQLLDLPLSSYWRLAQSPCCLNEIDIADGRVCIQRINETHHLEGIAA